MLNPDKDLITKFTAIVGEKYAITDPDVQAGYLHEQRERWVGHSPLVLRPDSTEQVAAILKLANETRTAIVPQAATPASSEARSRSTARSCSRSTA